jgi:hypothetical protein
MSEGNVATPFLEMRSFVREESEVFASERPTPALGSPFLTVYEADGPTGYADPQQEAYASLVQELYDQEFDEALFELMTEARGLHEEQLVSDGQSVEGERLLQQHFNQLIREAEGAVSAFEREFGARETASLTDGEIDAFAERYMPGGSLNPEFENFFGKWKKKLAGVVKKATKFAGKAASFAAKIGLGPVLNKIKALVKPLLNKVLQMAIGKLPESIRPAAEKLAEKIFGARARSADGAATPVATANDAAQATDGGGAAQAPVEPSVTEIQEEFDQQLVNLFLASDEVELELEVARVRNEDRRAASPVFSDLDQARERFVGQLQELAEGEDPSPHIQNFVPAILPALKLGVKLIGRGKVVNFLAGLLGKVIGKLIGPEAAPALSRAIVDTGLKLISLEVSSQDESRAAASSVAATVEETVRRVSNLPDYVLDDQELLEGFALEAFEQAAAANLPPILSEAVYRQRPDLLESRTRTAWVMLPLRSRKRYKKCGRTFKVRISPYMADEIESFEGPLADYLQDQVGIEEGNEIEAEVQLYETLPGTALPDIARAESEGPSGMNAAQLHPLTPQAAGLLFGEPRMGRPVPPGTGRMNVGVGQRLYALSIPGKRMLLTAPGSDGKPHIRRLGGLRITLDCPADEIRVCIFLSEVVAQRLAVRLRRQSHPGAVAALFHKYVRRRLGPIVKGERPTRLRVIQPGLPPGQAHGAALRRLPPDASAALAEKIQQSVVRAFATFAGDQARRFTTAAEDTADGVTLTFTIARAGLEALGKALVSAVPAGLAGSLASGPQPDVRIDVQPGFKCD